MVTISEELDEDPPSTSQSESEPEPSKEEGSGEVIDGWQTLMGEDLLMKVIKTEKPLFGEGKIEEIEPKDTVLVDVIGRFAETKDQTDGPIFQQAKGWLVVVGDGDVLPAVEMGIRFLKSGQTGYVWSHSKYAFGPGIRTYKASADEASYTLPPNSNVLYEVTVSQKVTDTSRLNPYFTIQKALTRKNIANDIYQNEWKIVQSSSSSSTTAATANKTEQNGTDDENSPDKKEEKATTSTATTSTNTKEEADVTMAMSRAVRLYQKAAKDMEALLQGTYFASVEEDHPQRHQARQLMLDCLNNIVAVHIRSEQYHQAKQAAVQVLQQDAKNLKALLRAAKAALMDPASTMEEASAALQAAEKHIIYKNVNEEKELKKLKQQLKRKQVEYKARSKEMFGNKLKVPNALGTKDDDDNNNKEQNQKEETTDNPPSLEEMDEISPNNVNSSSPSVASTGDNLSRMTSTLDDDDVTFWKSQFVSIGTQVAVVIGICAIVQYIFWKAATPFLVYNQENGGTGGIGGEEALSNLMMSLNVKEEERNGGEAPAQDGEL